MLGVPVIQSDRCDPNVVGADTVRAAVESVPDPELGGVTIGQLGMVESVHVSASGHVSVQLLPTFLGCPALDVIAADVRRAIASVDPAAMADVELVCSPPWSPDRISPSGRAALAEVGVAVGDLTGAAACPYCDAPVRAVAGAGASACRSIGWCDACRNPVEVMRRCDAPTQVSIALRSKASYAHL